MTRSEQIETHATNAAEMALSGYAGSLGQLSSKEPFA
jgi:hypothetical protein